MITVLREGHLRVVIFANDHEPAHVHVFGDGEAKIDLANGRVELVWAVHMTRAEVRKAVRLVMQHRDMLLWQWRQIHD